MSTIKNFKRTVLLAMMVYAVNCQSANNGTLNFSANVTRGTCEFSDSNELSKHVSFEQFFTIGDAEDTPIKAPIKESLGTKQFTYLIDCKEYEPDSEKKITINVKTGANTEYSDQVFYGKGDTTQTGFLVKGCLEGENASCQILENNKKLSFSSHSNSAISINYIVDFVRRNNNKMTPVDSTATILFEYIQD
ncbi:TPA: fimbrial protein [Proteus mirabilis]|nr:fimbrial protein [Proteus mirabilis]HEK2957148.1 fimbrial protein [Proteus mirabilis]